MVIFEKENEMLMFNGKNNSKQVKKIKGEV
jgi:hypothetical protein